MKIRICDKAISMRGVETARKIRVVNCANISTESFDGATPVYLVLYIDPETKEASVIDAFAEILKG